MTGPRMPFHGSEPAAAAASGPASAGAPVPGPPGLASANSRSSRPPPSCSRPPPPGALRPSRLRTRTARAPRAPSPAASLRPAGARPSPAGASAPPAAFLGPTRLRARVPLPADSRAISRFQLLDFVLADPQLREGRDLRQLVVAHGPYPLLRPVTHRPRPIRREARPQGVQWNERCLRTSASGDPPVSDRFPAPRRRKHPRATGGPPVSSSIRTRFQNAVGPMGTGGFGRVGLSR